MQSFPGERSAAFAPFAVDVCWFKPWFKPWFKAWVSNPGMEKLKNGN
jgi:hypothetical protein